MPDFNGKILFNNVCPSPLLRYGCKGDNGLLSRGELVANINTPRSTYQLPNSAVELFNTYLPDDVSYSSQQGFSDFEFTPNFFRRGTFEESLFFTVYAKQDIHIEGLDLLTDAEVDDFNFVGTTGFYVEGYAHWEEYPSSVGEVGLLFNQSYPWQALPAAIKHQRKLVESGCGWNAVETMENAFSLNFQRRLDASYSVIPVGVDLDLKAGQRYAIGILTHTEDLEIRVGKAPNDAEIQDAFVTSSDFSFDNEYFSIGSVVTVSDGFYERKSIEFVRNNIFWGRVHYSLGNKGEEVRHA